MAANRSEIRRCLYIDTERTCWDGPTPEGQTSEIISIAVVEVNVRDLKITRRASFLVQPKTSSVSPFCTELTGITQKQLDKRGQGLSGALYGINRKFGITHKKTFAWGADGPLIDKACAAIGEQSKFDVVDLGHLFSITYGLEFPKSVRGALEMLGLEFEGREHDALADATNTARIHMEMMRRVRVETGVTGLRRETSAAELLKPEYIGLAACAAMPAPAATKPVPLPLITVEDIDTVALRVVNSAAYRQMAASRPWVWSTGHSGTSEPDVALSWSLQLQESRTLFALELEDLVNRRITARSGVDVVIPGQYHSSRWVGPESTLFFSSSRVHQHPADDLRVPLVALVNALWSDLTGSASLKSAIPGPMTLRSDDSPDRRLMGFTASQEWWVPTAKDTNQLYDFEVAQP